MGLLGVSSGVDSTAQAGWAERPSLACLVVGRLLGVERSGQEQLTRAPCGSVRATAAQGLSTEGSKENKRGHTNPVQKYFVSICHVC